MKLIGGVREPNPYNRCAKYMADEATRSLFPRGELQKDGPRRSDTKSSNEKKRKRQKEDEADGRKLQRASIKHEVLFGTHDKQKKQKETAESGGDLKLGSRQSDKVLETCCHFGVRPGRRGRPASVRRPIFSSYHGQVLTLGVVRSVSERHMLVSLPGSLVGHVEVKVNEGRAVVGQVVRCCVTAASRVAASRDKSRLKRIELSIAPRLASKGLRLDDLVSGRVRTVGGRIMSREARGFLVDLGVSGGTGFLAFKHCALTEALQPGLIVECRVLKANAATGVIDLSRENMAAVAASSSSSDDADWRLSSIIPGQRFQCTVERRYADGLALSFANKQFAGVVDRNHLGTADLLSAKDVRDLPAFAAKGATVDARVLSVDRVNKFVRMTLLPHLLSLEPVSLPGVGDFVSDAMLVRFDAKTGALARADEVVAFVHVSNLPDSENIASKLGSKIDVRVVGSMPLEGWVLATARPESLNPATPIATSELKPGAVVVGVVVEAAGWGCIVRLSQTLKGSVTNAHISETVAKLDPRKRFANKSRQAVTCKVLKVEGRRISLTMKPSLVADTAEPLTSYARAAETAGRSYLGFVTGADDVRGLVVAFYNGIYGRVPPASLAARRRPLETFPLGSVVKVAVRRCAIRSGTKASLVLALADDEEDEDIGEALRDMNPGEVFQSARVVEITAFTKKLSKNKHKKEVAERPMKLSALVRVKGSPSFLARLDATETADHGACHGDDVLRAYARSGASFPVVVLEPPAAGGLARLSAQPLLVQAATQPAATGKGYVDRRFNVGEIAAGVVSATASYGIFVRFAAKHRGLVPKSLLADEFVDDAAAPQKYAGVGDAIRCAVDSVESDGRLILSTTRLPGDIHFSALFAATAAFEDAVQRDAIEDSPPRTKGRRCRRVKKFIELGAALDSTVVAKGADGSLHLTPAGQDYSATTAAYDLTVDADGSLDCAVGDLVKVRALCFRSPTSARRPTIACTMRPEVVRGGRRKRRAAAVAQLIQGKIVEASALPGSLLANGAACLALITEVGALALVALSNYHARGHKEHVDLMRFAQTTSGNRQFMVAASKMADLLDRQAITPYDELPVLVLPIENDNKVSLHRAAKKRRVSEECTSTVRARLEPVADPSNLELGDEIECRVLEVSERTLKCSVRVEDPTKRASVTIDASDTFLESRDTSGSASAHPMFGVNAVVGSSLRCRVLDVKELSGKGSDGKVRYSLRAALLGGSRALDQAVLARPRSWQDVESGKNTLTRLDAVVIGNEGAILRVSISPGMEGTVRTIDVVNALYEDARARTARLDVDGAILENVLSSLQAVTRPGSRLVVAPLNLSKRTLTVWLDEAGQPRAPPRSGDIVVARKHAGIKDAQIDCEHPAPADPVVKIDAHLELPLGLSGRLCPTEIDDKAGWVDLDKRPPLSSWPYARAVVLAVDRKKDGRTANKKMKSVAVYDVSTRPSRLALAEESDPSSAAAADPEPLPGNVVPGFVRRADAKAGVFVELSRAVVGRVLKKDLSDDFVEDIVAEFFPGRLVAPVVLSNVDKQGRVDVSLRPSDIANEAKTKIPVVQGAKLTGTVTRVESYGVFVKLDDAPRGYEHGLAHISELADDSFIDDIAARFNKGDRVKALILRIDEEVERDKQKSRSRRISLGLKPSYFSLEDSLDEVEDDHDSALDDDEVGARLDRLLQNDDDEEDDHHGEVIDELRKTGANDTEMANVEPAAAESADEEETPDDLDNDDDLMDLPSSRRGLQWDDEEGSQDDEENKNEGIVKFSPLMQPLHEDEVEAREAELASGSAPRTGEDFERLIIGNPDSGKLWTMYMAMRIAETDVVAARRIADRALRTINHRMQSERIRVWLSLIDLELTYSAETVANECIERACAANDPERLLVKVAAMHEKRGDHDRADAIYRKAEALCKSKLKLDTWLLHCRERLAASDHQGAHAILKRAIRSKYDRVALLSRFAVAEFDVGDKERGRTIFDKLLDDQPKRLDIWQIYVAKCIKVGNIEHARAVYERLAQAPLPPKRMQVALRQFVDFEQTYGDPASVEKVRMRAKEYVAGKLRDSADTG